MKQRSSKNFITSGLKGPVGTIPHPPRVTRESFPAIKSFATEFLFPNRTYMEMSAELQKSIQQDVESSFFDWMMHNRVKRQITTHVVKRNKYQDIVKKIILSFELEKVAKPAFKCEGDFDLPMVQVEELRLCASPFENLPVTGVIPFSRPIQLRCMPNSKPLTHPPQSDCNFSDSEEEMFPDGCMPFSEPLSPTLESMSFLNALPTFSLPHLQIAVDTVATESAADSSVLMNTSSVFEILPFPGVADTLHDIWNIQVQISRFLNGSSIDQWLDPNDWLQSKDLSDPLAKIDE